MQVKVALTFDCGLIVVFVCLICFHVLYPKEHRLLDIFVINGSWANVTSQRKLNSH